MDIRTRITITKITGESGLGTPFKVNLSKNISGITAEDLKFAVGDADIYVEEMKKLASDAETSAGKAKGSADDASKSAQDAADSLAAIGSSADEAAASAAAAKVSEQAAKSSEEAASESKDAAAHSAEAANSAADIVYQKVEESKESATQAKASETNAKASEEAAAKSAADADKSAQDAKASETAAAGSATNAAESLTSVTTKVTEADGILTDFKEEVVKAENVSAELGEKLDAGQQIVDATDANAKAAAKSAEEAASSASTALEHANSAKTAKTAAESSAATAKVEADKAANQATAATNQAVNASNSADRANEKALAAKASADYADELVGMAKSEVDKATQQADRAETEADRARDEADRAAENSAGIQPKQINGFAKYYLEAGAATADVNNRARGEFVCIGGTKTTPQVTINEVVAYVGNANSFKHVESFTPILSIQGVTANPQTGNIDSLPRATTTAYGTVKTTNTLNATVDVVPTSRPIFLRFEDVDTKVSKAEQSALDATLAAGKASSDLDAFKEEMTIALADKMDKSGEVTVESLYATGNIKGLAISGSSIGVYNGRGKQILLQFDYGSGTVPEIELQQANVAKYRYTFPEKSGKVALLSDIPEIGGPVEVPEASTSVHGTVLLSESISDLASTVPTTKAVFDAVKVKANSSEVYTKIETDNIFLKKEDAMEEIGAATADKAGIMKLYDDAGTQIDGTLTQKYISNAFGEINGSIQSIREDYDSQISGLTTQYDNLVTEVTEVHTTADNAMAGVNTLTPKVTRLESKAVMQDGGGRLYLGSYNEITLPGDVIVGSTGSSGHAVQILGAFYEGDRNKSAPVEFKAASGDVDNLKYFAEVRAKIRGSWKEFQFPFDPNGRSRDLVAGRYWCNDEFGEAKNLAQKQTGDVNHAVNWKGAHSFVGQLGVVSGDGSTMFGLSVDNNEPVFAVAKGTSSTSYVFPVSANPLQTIASQEWVNKYVYQSDNVSTIVRNPGGSPRLCVAIKDTGEIGFWDFSNQRWAFHHNQANWSVMGTGTVRGTGEYVGLRFEKSDKFSTTIETLPTSSSAILNIIQRDPSGGNRSVHSIPTGNGTILSIGANATVDGNGFIKKASPIVEILTDGNFRTNSESEGAYVYRLSEGVYRIDGVLGFNSDPAWGGTDGGIEIPLDNNKNPLVWVDYKVLEDGSIIIKTFHRENPTAPSFARNIKEGYKDGQPIDIPEGRFLSVRVQMPEVVEDEGVVEE